VKENIDKIRKVLNGIRKNIYEPDKITIYLDMAMGELMKIEVNKFEVVKGFAEKMINNSISLDSDIQDIINTDLWKLI
jgi:hypothetical protein